MSVWCCPKCGTGRWVNLTTFRCAACDVAALDVEALANGPRYVEPPHLWADTQRVHECTVLTETEANDIAHVIARARSEARAEALEEAAKLVDNDASSAMTKADAQCFRETAENIRALKETP